MPANLTPHPTKTNSLSTPNLTGQRCCFSIIPEHLLYDGHGSTRQLARPDRSVIDSYNYDGYGVLLQNANTFTPINQGGLGVPAGTTPQQATNLLYSGEQYDASAQQYYLRARYYNPANGLFNRTDPYAGNLQDPQSLHKYTYVHNNPMNAIDPSGNNPLVIIGGAIAIVGLVTFIIGTLMKNTWAQSIGFGLMVLGLSVAAAAYSPLAAFGVIAFGALMAVGVFIHGLLLDEATSNVKEGLEKWEIQEQLRYFFQYYCTYISNEAPRFGILVFRKGSWDDIGTHTQISEFYYTDEPRMSLYEGDYVLVYGYEGNRRFNVEIFNVDKNGEIDYDKPMKAGVYDINMSGIAIETKRDYDARYRESAKSRKYTMGWSEISN